jgi:hypothetical protein
VAKENDVQLIPQQSEPQAKPGTRTFQRTAAWGLFLGERLQQKIWFSNLNDKKRNSNRPLYFFILTDLTCKFFDMTRPDLTWAHSVSEQFKNRPEPLLCTILGWWIETDPTPTSDLSFRLDPTNCSQRRIISISKNRK